MKGRGAGWERVQEGKSVGRPPSHLTRRRRPGFAFGNRCMLAKAGAQILVGSLTNSTVFNVILKHEC